MRLVKWLLLGIVILSLVILIFGPPLIGWKLQNNADFANVAKLTHLNIETLHYKRGWFSSDVAFKLKFDDPKAQHYLNNLTLNSEALPHDFEIVMQGHIQHGPIFYFPVKQMPLMGWALMTRKTILTSKQQRFLNRMGFDSALIGASSSYLSFTGQYWEYLNLHNVRWLSQEGIQIQLKNIKTKFQLSNQGKHIKGQIHLQDFSLGDHHTQLTLPDINLVFDMEKELHGLWIGSQTLALSQIKMRDADQVLELLNIKFTGAMQEKNGLLSGNRNLNIEKILFNDQRIGPVELLFSAKNLNAKAISHLIETYQDVVQQGEMYEFQLKQRLSSVIPDVIVAGSTIELNKLNVKTMDGQLQMNAKIFWPTQNFVPLTNIIDLMQSLKTTLNLRISIPLANRLMSLLAKLTYAYQLSIPERQTLIDMQDSLRLSTQVNAYAILDLMKEGAIPKEDGIELLAKIRNDVSLQDYTQEIKKLLFVRKIDLKTSHELNFLYRMLWGQVDDLERQVLGYQQANERFIQNQVDQYIKAGFIIQDKDEYTFSLVRENSIVKINGHQQLK